MEEWSEDDLTDEVRTKADLQVGSDCPADWCKCECHCLSPEEEEEPPESQQQQERRRVSTGGHNPRLMWDLETPSNRKQLLRFSIQRTQERIKHVCRQLKYFNTDSPPGLAASVKICMLEIRLTGTSKGVSPSSSRKLMTSREKGQ